MSHPYTNCQKAVEGLTSGCPRDRSQGHGCAGEGKRVQEEFPLPRATFPFIVRGEPGRPLKYGCLQSFAHPISEHIRVPPETAHGSGRRRRSSRFQDLTELIEGFPQPVYFTRNYSKTKFRKFVASPGILSRIKPFHHDNYDVAPG